MERPKVVRVNKVEFELSDGSVHPMMFDVGEKAPTVKEFQRIYDQWYELFRELGLVNDDEQEDGGDR